MATIRGSLAVYADVLRDYPNQPKVWMSYGHALKTAGRVADGIAAYRHGIAQMPHLGEAYWSLANLKTFRFAESDLAAMAAQLARPDLGDDDRFHFHFALGKACEDSGDYRRVLQALQRGQSYPQSPARVMRPRRRRTGCRRMTALFTPAFFDARAGAGVTAPDPIFVVGLPRSGSTLIEQILSSHSAIEGTMELPDLPVRWRWLLGGRRNRTDKSLYPESLGELDHDRLRAMGEDYLTRTRVQRKTDRPFFIDKTPHNFFHVGMIRVILPNAKIIDARRHPLAACFSGFKQHFARGQSFQLRPRRYRALLPRLCRPDGAFR